jgi:hypothetical protein
MGSKPVKSAQSDSVIEIQQIINKESYLLPDLNKIIAQYTVLPAIDWMIRQDVPHRVDDKFIHSLDDKQRLHMKAATSLLYTQRTWKIRVWNSRRLWIKFSEPDDEPSFPPSQVCTLSIYFDFDADGVIGASSSSYCWSHTITPQAFEKFYPSVRSGMTLTIFADIVQDTIEFDVNGQRYPTVFTGLKGLKHWVVRMQLLGGSIEILDT